MIIGHIDSIYRFVAPDLDNIDTYQQSLLDVLQRVDPGNDFINQIWT
jgi:hypothetical protein